jgi:hypothetical protein
LKLLDHIHGIYVDLGASEVFVHTMEAHSKRVLETVSYPVGDVAHFRRQSGQSVDLTTHLHPVLNINGVLRPTSFTLHVVALRHRGNAYPLCYLTVCSTAKVLLIEA